MQSSMVMLIFFLSLTGSSFFRQICSTTSELSVQAEISDIPFASAKTLERDGEHLSVQLLWATARLLVTRFIHLVDELSLLLA